MLFIDHVRAIADMAWAAMRTHKIAPTPRNYEIWFTFSSADKPALTKALDALIASGAAIDAGVMDEMYRTFFATAVDISAVSEGSGALQQIATDMADRVAADRGLVEALGGDCDAYASLAGAAPAQAALVEAAATLASSSAKAGERLRALEDLFTVSIRRIGDLKERLAKAEQDATRDALTGVANRRYFDAALQRAIARSQEDGSDLALLILDIDHFKQFNDNFGHSVGDNVLRLVARSLTEHLKGRDVVARYGGEEFAMILPGTSLVNGMIVANQIRAILEKRPIINRVSGQRFGVVTCSVGVALYRAGEMVGALVDRADEALYRAKRTGRNRVCAEEEAAACIARIATVDGKTLAAVLSG